MKKILMLSLAAAVIFSGCKKDDPIPVASVTVDPATQTVEVGAALPTLTAKITPTDAGDKSVKWSSDKATVITVNESTGALAWAVQEIQSETETVVITATASNGKSASATITVTRKPIPVSGGTITASAEAFVVDEELPTLSVAWTPEGAVAPTSVAWSSDTPTVLDVTSAGVLELKVADVADPVEVVISATAQPAGVTASVTLTVQGKITRYEVIDCSAELGLLVLDRNVGATAAYDPDATDNTASIGNYYQWGKNVIVAYGAQETADAELFDPTWNAEGENFSDWSVPANTPCPIGWSIPDKDQTELIANKAWADYDWGTQTDEEFEAAKALYKKLKIARNGAFRVQGEKYLPRAGYFWSSYLNVVDGPNAEGIKMAYAVQDNYDINRSKRELVTYAMPVRCVKAASVQ
ncbi:MAG: Ig-like domain-containing protein [Rikenellaceae bacterium]|jgi:uncharacterized protein (TIGR02145 family)|nr:Ig-like domain-containing protein [Rikenellaceae bacterium]